MALDPRLVHYLDQLSGAVREVGEILAAARRRLVEDGVPEAEARAMVQRLEKRILGPIFDDAEEIVGEHDRGQGVDGASEEGID